jgi:hypothetical protein
MLQLCQKVLAKAPSTHDPKRTFPIAFIHLPAITPPPTRRSCCAGLMGNNAALGQSRQMVGWPKSLRRAPVASDARKPQIDVRGTCGRRYIAKLPELLGR